MEAETLEIVSSRSIPDLVERVHAVAKKLFEVEHTALAIPSMSGSQVALVASTDSSTKWG